MATFIPVPRTAEVVLDALLWGEQCVNTFYFERASDITQLDLEELTVELAGSVSADLVDRLPESWNGVRIVATDLTTNPGLQSITLLSGAVGAQDSTLDGSTCISVKRSSALTGRSNRGRIYWPLWDSALAVGDPNFITPTAAAQIVGVLNSFNAAAVAVGWTPVVVSKYADGAPRVTGKTEPMVGWSVADFAVDNQRRRLAGRGS